MSVKEVTAALGYHIFSLFSCMFKSVNDVMPQEYRVTTEVLEYSKKVALRERLEGSRCRFSDMSIAAHFKFEPRC